MIRRHFVALSAAALAGTAGAQQWPVRLVVAHPPGGGTDAVARTVFDVVVGRLGQPFVIENRARAGSSTGLGELTRSARDGHTVGIGGSSDPLLPHLYDELAFNPARDLGFVATLATVPMLLTAGPPMPAQTLRELAALSHEKAPWPGASPGVATPHRLASVHSSALSGIPLTHVPYKGTGQALSDMLARHVPLARLALPSVPPAAQDGRLNLLGIATRRRSTLAPELPKLAEAGVRDFDVGYWHHALVPAGTPAAIVERLSEGTDAALQSAEVGDKLLKAGFESLRLTPAHTEAVSREGSARWVRVIREHTFRGN